MFSFNKRLIIYLGIITLVATPFILILLNKDEIKTKELIVKKEPTSNLELSFKNEIADKKEPKEAVKIDTNANTPIVEENKGFVLLHSSDDKQRYQIKLMSKVRIEHKQIQTKYIDISGSINNEYRFYISLSEQYLDRLDDIYISVQDITEDNHEAICDASFLNGIQKDYEYTTLLSLNDNSLVCEIVAQKELPDLIKNFDPNNMKFIELE